MKTKQKILIILAIIFCSLRVVCQDVTFSQFYSNPLYLNPAFAGSIDAPRVAMQYRNQWPGFSKAYTTYSLGFDMPVEKLQGGMGILILNDAQANNALNKLQVEVMYSKFTRLNKNFTMNGAIQAGFHQNSLVWDKLIFPDNVDPNYGNHGISQETPISDPNFTYFDVSAGILLYSEKLFLGIAGHHINEPKQSYYQGQEDVGVLYRKYTLHFGATFNVFLQGHLRKKFDLSPQVILQTQGSFKQFNYGLFINRKGLSGGMWLRQNLSLKNDALIFLVGFIKDRWRFTYSYDWTISGLAGLTGGSNEISLSFLLKDPSRKSSLPFFRLPSEY
ncbi:MAG: PorP/SprF family type IX secretion system membrane protein [Prolixibacteraceae bacterium]|nr:PorP/SprF family type IX secretion system membrane protein [Prolixibacteraceae bacterium]